MLQTGQGELYFANRQGVLEFDGKTGMKQKCLVPYMPWQYWVMRCMWLGLLVEVNSIKVGGTRGLHFAVGRKFYWSRGVGKSCVLSCKRPTHCFGSENQPGSLDLKDRQLLRCILELFTIGNEIYLRSSNRGLQNVQDQKLVSASFAPANLIFANQAKAALLGMDDDRCLYWKKGRPASLH